MNRKSIVIGSAGVLVLIFVVGAFVFKDQQRKALDFLTSEKASVLVRDDSMTLGDDDARVYIVEFLDPGCETCRIFAGHVKDLMAAHPGKIKLVIRYTPFHQGADVMCRILEAARGQGKYWETLQLMFDTQPQWANHHQPRPEKIWEYLPRIGLDLDKLRRDMDQPEIYERIRQDMADAAALQVRKTPTFFVNGKRLSRFGLAQLTALVKAEIAVQY